MCAIKIHSWRPPVAHAALCFLDGKPSLRSILLTCQFARNPLANHKVDSPNDAELSLLTNSDLWVKWSGEGARRPPLAVESRHHENREGFRINDKSSLDLFALSERTVGVPGEDHLLSGDGRSVQSPFCADSQRPGLLRRIRRARRRVLRRGFAPAFDEDSRPDREAPGGDSRPGKPGDGAGQLPGFQS